MQINTIAKEIHQINKSKGFWEVGQDRNIGELLMLCVSELSEALEAHRKHGSLTIDEDLKNQYDKRNTSDDYMRWFEENVKNTFSDEIADTMIRLMDLSAGLGIDLEWHITAKLEYNKRRTYKHGKLY